MTDSDDGHDRDSKIDPETLVLRAKPRRVARFNRRVVVGVAAGGCALVFVATIVALHPPSLHRGSSGDELLGTNQKSVADGLAGLPKSYGDLKPTPPKLGPPLPGDLGPPVTHVEHNLGVGSPPPENYGLRPNPEEDAERAERMRLARQAQEARESKIFFPVSMRQGQMLAGMTGAGAGQGGAASAASMPNSADAAPAKLDLDPDRDSNDQQRKLSFLNQKQDERAIYNPHSLQHPISPYEVMAGTIISASLITGLKSDLPGLVVAQVTEDVRDTVTGRILLIPQGSRLVGTYDSVIAFGQRRALLVWQRIIMPNGTSVVIDNLPATDTSGYAGLEDEVDFHTWQLLEGVGLSTLLGVGSQATFGSSQSNLVQAIRESTSESVNQAGQRIVEKDINIQPTITVRPGWPLRIIAQKDLVLQPYNGSREVAP